MSYLYLRRHVRRAHCITADRPIGQPLLSHGGRTTYHAKSSSASLPGQPSGPGSPYLRGFRVYSARLTGGQQRSISTAKMPFPLSSLISARANHLSPRSPTNSRCQRKLYFPPGGHTHDRHSIPPDRLHISLSDPVLVAAEERLSGIPPGIPNQSSSSPIKESTARKSINPGSIISHLGNDEILLQISGDYNDRSLYREAVNPSTMGTTTHALGSSHFLKTELHRAVAQDPRLVDACDDSCDIVEVMSMSFIDASPGDADSSASENSRNGPDLAPLASENFKEELYIRGYLKRPASRPANVIPRKSRTSFKFVSRKLFPKVLGRRQERNVAESLKTDQDAANPPDERNARLCEDSTVVLVTLRAPHADGLESPGMDTNTSTSELFDLHEFSYITAFTTPPSSPSIVLDAEAFKKGVCLSDSKHAV